MNITQEFGSFCENASENDTTDIIWQLQGGFRISAMVLAVFQILILSVGLPWNLMVIVTIVKEKLYKHPTIVLLLNLVTIDFLYIILVLPINIVVGTAGEFILGRSDLMRCNSCQIGILDPIFPILSIYAITFLSFDRLFYFYKPLHYKSIVTIPRILVAISTIWLVVLIISAIPLFNIGKINDIIVFYRPFAACTLISFTNDVEIEVVFIVLIFIIICLPLIVLIVCNICVIYIVQKTIREVYNAKANNEDVYFNEKIKQIRQKKQFHLIKVFGGLIISCLISWLPMTILIFLFYSSGNNYKDYEKVPTAFQVIAFIFFRAQVAIHPILETTLIRDVRKPLMKMLCCFSFKRRSHMSAPAQLFIQCCQCDMNNCCTLTNTQCWRLDVFCTVISENSEVPCTSHQPDYTTTTV